MCLQSVDIELDLSMFSVHMGHVRVGVCGLDLSMCAWLYVGVCMHMAMDL